MEEFKEAVKRDQSRHGEQQFNWDQHTDKLIAGILTSLGTRYLTEGQLQHIATQMPKEVQHLFPVSATKEG